VPWLIHRPRSRLIPIPPPKMQKRRSHENRTGSGTFPELGAEGLGQHDENQRIRK